MRRTIALIAFILAAYVSHAQQVRLYGVTEGKGQPMAGVMIMVFEDDHFYKKFITDKKGGFRFNVGGRNYTILFYKPGMEPAVYHIINKMESDILKIPVNMDMTPTTLSPDSLLTQSPLFTRATPDVSAAYIKAIYDYDHRRDRRDTVQKATRRALMRRAIEERDRFASYSQHRDTSGLITTTIGPDTYEMVTDAKGAHRYTKNDKPITETTYTFETTRRYEGVLKNKRDVRRFEKYQPMQHVR